MSIYKRIVDVSFGLMNNKIINKALDLKHVQGLMGCVPSLSAPEGDVKTQ